MNHPLKWNDEEFFFDHDFNPTKGRSIEGPREPPGSFFEDFAGFHRPESHNDDFSNEGGPKSRDFGASDGFPNFFNGTMSFTSFKRGPLIFIYLYIFQKGRIKGDRLIQMGLIVLMKMKAKNRSGLLGHIQAHLQALLDTIELASLICPTIEEFSTF